MIIYSCLYFYRVATRRELLKNYFDSIVLKDCVVRHKISDIQVCYELTTTNQKREYAGFDRINEGIKLKRKIILTYNQEEQIGDIEVIPAWKYFF